MQSKQDCVIEECAMIFYLMIKSCDESFNKFIMLQEKAVKYVECLCFHAVDLITAPPEEWIPGFVEVALLTLSEIFLQLRINSDIRSVKSDLLFKSVHFDRSESPIPLSEASLWDFVLSSMLVVFKLLKTVCEESANSTIPAYFQSIFPAAVLTLSNL